MTDYQRLTNYSPMKMIKKSYDITKDICRGLYIAGNGAYSKDDMDFARKVGIKPKYERMYK